MLRNYPFNDFKRKVGIIRVPYADNILKSSRHIYDIVDDIGGKHGLIRNAHIDTVECLDYR